jgi:hypothetical protein
MKTFKVLRNRFPGTDSASLCNLAGKNINRVVVQESESMPGNPFLGSLKVNEFGLRMHHAYTREYR